MYLLTFFHGGVENVIGCIRVFKDISLDLFAMGTTDCSGKLAGSGGVAVNVDHGLGFDGDAGAETGALGNALGGVAGLKSSDRERREWNSFTAISDINSVTTSCLGHVSNIKINIGSYKTNSPDGKGAISVVCDRSWLVKPVWIGNTNHQVTFTGICGINGEFDRNRSRDALNLIKTTKTKELPYPLVNTSTSGFDLLRFELWKDADFGR